ARCGRPHLSRRDRDRADLRGSWRARGAPVQDSGYRKGRSGQDPSGWARRGDRALRQARTWRPARGVEPARDQVAGRADGWRGAIQVGRPFDIALIEHRPPSIDGLEISTSLRSLRRPEQMPIVLIASASSGPAEAAAADGGVIQATLTKPVPPRTLHDVMIQLGGRGAQPQVAQQVEPGQLRVLIADDNALNQNLLKRLVAKLGHTADVVSNGREAVASVAQQ